VAETPPQTVLAGRYVLEDEIGRGGMASVWRATDEVLDRPVAVKILHEHLSDDPTFLERFSSEALAAARLTHPNMVNVFDTGSENGISFIVMELFDGTTLADLLRREGPLEPERAVAIMLSVLSALQFAHENDVVHRDVKPANILVSSTGMVKITDLGIARAAYADTDVTTTGRVLGSVPYLSPEQVQGADMDARSDVFACGVVLYEMLTGRLPFAAETDLAAAMMRLTRDPLPPRAIRPGIPRSLEAVVQRAMARRTQDRFQTSENMAAALVRVRGPMQMTPAPPAIPPASRPGGSHGSHGAHARTRSVTFRSWMLVPLLAVLLAALTIVIGLVLGKLQLGGPLGITTNETSPSASVPPASAALPVSAVTAFDPPPGDGHEHDERIQDVLDADPSSVWYTENYRDLNLAPKPGVGLLFDLGESRSVGAFLLQTPFPGFRFEIKVGDDPQTILSAAGPSYTAAGNMREALADAATGRYVLLWITEVVPGVEGGNRAAVGTFRVFGG
jgi:serine/threonine protein kinase